MTIEGKTSLLKQFFMLTVIESAATLYALISIPADTKHAFMLGFSASRLALIFVVLAACFLSFLLLTWLSTSQKKIEPIVRLLDNFLFDVKKRRVFALVCGFIATAGIIFMLTPAERINESIYQRILPVVSLIVVITLQLLFFQFIYRGEKIQWHWMKNLKQTLTVAGIALAGFALVWLFIAWSKVGVTPEKSGWLTPGTPILAQQVLFAWLIGSVFILFENQLDRYKKIDIVIAILIWGIAGMVWYSEPMTHWGYFTPKPTPPNFEYYPHSDAALYDEYSQNILIGAGKQAGVFIRPLYVLFLAVLHVIVGQEYESVVTAQTFIVAVIPSLIYLLAAKLSGRPSGIVAAILMLLREKNSIALTNIVEVSHSKLLMSELPMLALLLSFVLFWVLWLSDQKNRMYFGIFAGAFFGLAMMIRSQIQFLTPVIIMAIMVFKWDGWKPVSKRVLVFMLGLLVVVTPWLWRNYQTAGRAVVEYPGSFTKQFANSYVESKEDLEFLPGETQEEYGSRMTGLIIKSIISNPLKIFRRYFSYFVHNEILSLTYLPMSFRFYDLYHYVDVLPFWNAPAQPLPARVLPILFMTICVIAFGIGAAFQRLGWVGAAFPLLFHFLYSFSVTLIYISGWRFIQPVDWVSLLYLSIGLMQITALVFSLFAKEQVTTELAREPSSPMMWGKFPFVLGVFVVMGLSISLFEKTFPEIYPTQKDTPLIQKYMRDGLIADDTMLSAVDMESFLDAEPGAVVEYGRALYPSYYEQDGYWGDAAHLAESKQYDRLEFRLIGVKRIPVFLPLKASPEYFPHASDVFIIGCESPNAIRALVVIVNGTPVSTSPWNGLTCNEK